MIAELGHFALILALALALAQSTIPFAGALRGDPRLMAVAGPAAVTQFLLVGIAFALLINAYVALRLLGAQRRRELALGEAAPLQGHRRLGEPRGLDAPLGADPRAVRRAGRGLRRQPAGPAEGAGAVGAGAGSPPPSSLFILFTSNPFLRLVPAPIEGNDLNPVLQDIGLAIHPPLLYLGYVGCSISFAFAVAALIDGRIDAAWARWVRPWTLAAWMFLTLGIAMGSYWAYYELGWGGFWFWDPVENASFMPWLAVTALLHSAIVMEKRERAQASGPCSSPSSPSRSRLLGTFLVRSGVLTSVHTFAADPDPRRLHPRHPRDLHRRRARALRLPRRERWRRAASSRRSAARARSSSTTCS